MYFVCFFLDLRLEAAAKAHLASGRAAAAVRALLRRGAGGALAAAEVALLTACRGAPEKHAVLRAAAELAEAGSRYHVHSLHFTSIRSFIPLLLDLRRA